MPNSIKRKFRLQFSLRTLFVLVTVFGVWLGWQFHVVKRRKECLKSMEATGDYCILADDLPPTEPAPQIFWGRRLMGDCAVYQIYIMNYGLEDEQQRIRQRLESIRSIFSEAEVMESSGGMSASAF